MSPTQSRTFGPLFLALLALGLIHASGTEAWRSPSTYVGILTGVSVVAIAWIGGAHRRGTGSCD